MIVSEHIMYRPLPGTEINPVMVVMEVAAAEGAGMSEVTGSIPSRGDPQFITILRDVKLPCVISVNCKQFHPTFTSVVSMVPCICHTHQLNSG